MRENLINIRTSIGIIASIFIFVIIGIFFRGAGYSDNYSLLASIASFLFGIFVAFSITSSHSKLNKINEILKTDEANLLSIYKLSKLFGSEKEKHVKELIDKYLVDQIDYFLQDFKYSSKSFFNLFEYLISLESENKKQEAAYQSIMSLLTKSSSNRKQVETYVQEKMSKYEWISILVLLFLILFFIFSINTGTLISNVLTILLAASATMLVFVLRDLDNLRWKEDAWIWEPLNNLFNALDLVPYYPKVAIDSGRLKLKKGQKIRVTEYPNPYPDMNGKIVKEITI